MRLRLLIVALIAALSLAPAAQSAPPVLTNGHFAGSTPPAPPHADLGSPITSFKVEVLH